MTRPVLAVGWDVGGWCGDRQAVAVATWDGTAPSWLGQPVKFSIRQLESPPPRVRAAGGSLEALIQLAWTGAPPDVLADYHVVLAIDAPLGFPREFVDLLCGKDVALPQPRKFSENVLAFRECDRVISARKLPLSASFDKLGNPATVAMFYARKWSRGGKIFMLPVQPSSPDASAIIEVYPALAKQEEKGRTDQPWRSLALQGRKERTDECDASLCALMALAFAPPTASPLPCLVRPPREHPFDTEGWIYYPGPPTIQGEVPKGR